MPQIYPENRGINYAIKLGKKVDNDIIERCECKKAKEMRKGNE